MPQLVYEIGSKKWRGSWKKLPKNSLAYAAGVEYPTILSKDELIDIIEKGYENVQNSLFKKGDTVITKYSVLNQFDHPLDKSGTLPKLGKEKFIVSKIEWWQQANENIVYGEKSDKRNYGIWHNESDLELYKG